MSKTAMSQYTARDGKVYPVSPYHLCKGKISICPVCDARPCTWDCPEHYLPDRSGDRANTAEAQQKVPQPQRREDVAS